jgi:hypothetical protein
MSSERDAIVEFGEVVITYVSKFADIIIEILRAASQNVLLAAGVLIFAADILEKQIQLKKDAAGNPVGLISSDTAGLVKGLAVAVLGVDAAAAVISSFIPLKSGGGGIVIIPGTVANTYGESKGKGQVVNSPATQPTGG